MFHIGLNILIAHSRAVDGFKLSAEVLPTVQYCHLIIKMEVFLKNWNIREKSIIYAEKL